MLRNLLLAAARVLILTFWCMSAGDVSPKRTVTGKVVGADGVVLASASIEAVPLGTVGDSGTVSAQKWMATDNEGRFQISLSPGRYEIRAKDEMEGYPDPNFLLSADQSAKFPEVSVRNADISGLQVTLGGRGGVIEGSLRDADSQTAIPKAKITISDVTNHGVFVELFSDKEGRFRFTVPTKPIQVFATAPGYTSTYFLNGQDLILSGGEHRTIVLELRHK